MMPSDKYIPALRFHWLTKFYDKILEKTMKDKHFKQLLIQQAKVESHHRVLDLGCGTATLTILLKQAHPESHVFGLDGDLNILSIGKEKAEEAELDISFIHALSHEIPAVQGGYERVVSSLFFHHIGPDAKIQTLEKVYDLLSEDGELHIVDWGKAQNPLMRFTFFFVQLLDGFQTTKDNVAGKLPEMMREVGFSRVEETHREMTIFGTLSMYKGIK